MTSGVYLDIHIFSFVKNGSGSTTQPQVGNAESLKGKVAFSNYVKTNDHIN